MADSFVMHPPFGIFDGAGKAEEEHVMPMALFAALGISVLVLQRRMGKGFNPSIQFVIGVAAAYLVLAGHQQHTMAGTMGHDAVILLAAIATMFRVMGSILEYAMAMIVAGFVFFSSHMGLAMYVDMAGNSGGAWVAGWAMAGFPAATIYLALAAPARAVPAEQARQRAHPSFRTFSRMSAQGPRGARADRMSAYPPSSP